MLRPISRWLPPLALIEHVGRRTGIAYTTPVQAYRTDHGYIVALAYDRNAGWARNLLAAGGGEMTRAGKRYQLTNPRRSGSEAFPQLPRVTARLQRALDVREFIEFDAEPTAHRSSSRCG